jgi:uncharacterized UBP type Zn finger protein
MSQICSHIIGIKEIKRAKKRECDVCVKIKSYWVHLRTCQECGATLCCDSSPNKHASKHYHETGHSVVASAEIGEQWLWCFKDEELVEY